MGQLYEWGSVISYIGPGNDPYNAFIMKGDTIKRLTYLRASYGKSPDLPDPYGQGRVIVVAGDLALDFTSQIDSLYAKHPDVLRVGASKILLDTFVYYGEGDLLHGQILETDKTLTIVQLPMYLVGDTPGIPTPLYATLTVYGSSIFRQAETGISGNQRDLQALQGLTFR